MAIIAVAGRKGGIGKSTIAGNLAGEFVSMGYTVVLLDADPQHSLVEWAAQGKGLLATCVQAVKLGDPNELKVRTRAAQKAADLVLIDTPPGMPETTAQALLLADLALLPCGPSPLDLFALKEALSLALHARAARRSKKPRIRFVLLGEDGEESAAGHQPADRRGGSRRQRSHDRRIRRRLALSRGVPATG